MLEQLRYRGPDEGYLHFEDEVFLGVRRLAIVNVQHGAAHVQRGRRRRRRFQRRDLQSPRVGAELAGSGYSFAKVLTPK